jgi:hypothetical protein
MDQNEPSLNPFHQEVPSATPKMIFEAIHVPHKPCTHLASRLTLSPNELKRVSTWPTSCRSTIVCVQNDFWAYGTLGANVHQSCAALTLSPNILKQASTNPWHLGVLSGAPKMIFEPIARSAQIVYLSCVKINSISKWTKTSFHLTHIT